MSAGCAVIASDTAPVLEVINGENGLLVPFFDIEGLSRRVVEVLEEPQRFETMRAKAREFVKANYDAERICAPKFLSLLGQERSVSSRSSRRKKPVRLKSGRA